jgi:hypothetical protein
MVWTAVQFYQVIQGLAMMIRTAIPMAMTIHRFVHWVKGNKGVL